MTSLAEPALRLSGEAKTAARERAGESTILEADLDDRSVVDAVVL